MITFKQMTQLRQTLHVLGILICLGVNCNLLNKIFGFEMPCHPKKSVLNVIGKPIPMKIQDFLGTNEKEGWNFGNIT